MMSPPVRARGRFMSCSRSIPRSSHRVRTAGAAPAGRPLPPTGPACAPPAVRARRGRVRGTAAQHLSVQRTATTEEPCPNSPWFAVIPTRAPAT